MASAGFGKIRPKKPKTGVKPYDGDRKESFLGRMKSRVKDMLTPSWLYAPAAAYESDDDDGGEEGEDAGGGSSGRDVGQSDERSAGASVAAGGASSTREASAERASSENGTRAAERGRVTSASQTSRHTLVEPREALGAASATAAASSSSSSSSFAAAAQLKGGATTGVFPSPEIRKRVRREFFHLAEDGVPARKQPRVAGASSADGASASSSSLAVIPDDSGAYQRDILLMSKRSLERHKHELSPKESESAESELTEPGTASDKSTAAVHPSVSCISDGDTLNGPTLQSLKPSFSVSTFTSSFMSLNESASFLNAPATGESSFYAGKTTFGGASAYRRTPLAVSIQPSTKSTLFSKRTSVSGSTAVTSATAKRILDTLEKMASPAPATLRSKDLGSSGISQSAADTLLAFKPLPYLSRRRMQPASKISMELSSQPATSSLTVPPLAKLPTVNASGMVGRRNALAYDNSGMPKANLPTDYPKSLSAKVETVPSNGLEAHGRADLPPQIGASSGNDRAGGKLKPSRERGRAHYSRPSTDEVEPAPFASTLSTAFTLPAESVKGFDIFSAKPLALASSVTENACAEPSAVDGSVAPTQFSFSSPVALQPSVPDSVTKKQSDIKPFIFRNPADVDKSAAAGRGFAASGESCAVDDKAFGGAATTVPSFLKADGRESRSAPVASAAPTSSASISSAAGAPIAGASAWSGTLLTSLPASGSWDCDACLVNNRPGCSVCCACGSRRQPPEKADASLPQQAPPVQWAAAAPAVGAPVDIFKQAPPAGWECSVCLVRNGKDKSRCVACNSVWATKTEVTAAPGLPKPVDIFKQPAGGWECVTCLVRNPSEKVSCVACGTRKPSAEGSAGASTQQSTKVAVDIFKQPQTGWECGACLLRNSSDTLKCAACGCGKTGPATTVLQHAASPAVDIFKRPAAGWECATCLLQNSSDKAKCVACNSAKPGAGGAPTGSTVPTSAGSSVPASETGFGNIFKVPSGSWNCIECFVQNKPDAAQCAACGSRKPGLSQAPAVQSKPAAEATGLLSASSQVTTSDQNKPTSTIRFGGTSSGASLFGTSFKPLPTVLKFGGELPPSSAASPLQVTPSTDKDRQSKASPSGNAQQAMSSQPSFSMAHTTTSENKTSQSGLKLPAFTSFGAMPSTVSFGAQPLAGQGAAKIFDGKPIGQNTEDLPTTSPAMAVAAQAGPFRSDPAFTGQPATSSALSFVFSKPVESSSASIKPFSIGGSSANAGAVGATPQPSSLFGTTIQQPSTSFASTSSSITPGSAFVFGGTPQAGGLASLPASGFAFGNSQAQPKPPAADSVSLFKFGSATSQPQGSSEVAPKNPASVFGRASAQSEGNTVVSKVPLIFGNTSLQTQAGLSTSTGGFSFGSSSAQSAETADSSKSGFGQQSVVQSSGFSFGKAASLPPANAAGGLFQFGGPQKTDSDRGLGLFTFGSAVAAGSNVSTSLFGGSAPAQPGESIGTLASEANPFAPSQGPAGRAIRKIPRKFNK